MLVIANFKQNFNQLELHKYFKEWKKITLNFKMHPELKIIFCPSYPHLQYVNEIIQNFKNTFCGAQNVSKFKQGPYTGETGASQLKDFVKYCLVGHSERRLYFNETKEDIKEKIDLLKQNSITPIVCVSRKEELYQEFKGIYAFEPLQNIGTGKAASLQVIKNFLLNLKKTESLIYGGSVNPQNVKKLMKEKRLKGFLVGTASLKPYDFFSIIKTVNTKLKTGNV